MAGLIHIAGYRPVIGTIVEHQSRRGSEACEIATRELTATAGLTVQQLSTLLSNEAKDIPLIHLHDPSPFFNSTLKELEHLESLLKNTADTGVKVVLSLDGDVAKPRNIAVDVQERIDRILQNQVAGVFLASAEWHSLINRLDNWSWLPVPIDLSGIPAPTTFEVDPVNIRVLHLAFNSAVADSKISALLHDLAVKDSRFKITVHPVQDFSTVSELRAALRENDVIVERISRPMYGWVALEGMAHGKTVLSGIHPQHREEWQQLEFSPVLDCNEGNLTDRLLSLAKEPRSMRDIGRRSRHYVENFHNAEQIISMMLEIYGQL